MNSRNQAIFAFSVFFLFALCSAPFSWAAPTATAVMEAPVAERKPCAYDALAKSSPRALTPAMRVDPATRKLVVSDGENTASLPIPSRDHRIGPWTGPEQMLSQLRQEVRLNGRSFSRLTAGEDLGAFRFTEGSRNDHFNKHVLGMHYEKGARPEPLDSWMDRFIQAPEKFESEFTELRDSFAERYLNASTSSIKQILLKQATLEYEDAAAALLRSKDPAVLTLTNVVNNNGQPTVTSYKFNPATGEIAIVNRLTGMLITYYRVTMPEARRVMRSQFQGAPIENPTEYFLVIGLNAPPSTARRSW